MTISIYQVENRFLLIDHNKKYIYRQTLAETIDNYFTQGKQGKLLAECRYPLSTNAILLYSYTLSAFQDKFPEYFI